MIVVPMAGLSSRFADAGYTLPKYMLPAKGKTLFEHAVGSFSALFDSEPFLFIFRDVFSTEEFVDRCCRRLGIRSYRCVVLGEPTSGQAETVAIGLEQVGIAGNEPVTIFNIDTFRPGFTYPAEVSSDGYLEVFRGSGMNWSYVRPAAGGSRRVLETAEKNPISDLCCTGLYYFKNYSIFLSAYRDYAGMAKELIGVKELYVAPMYNILIKAGADIRYHLIDEREVVFCGVPAEYEEFVSSN